MKGSHCKVFDDIVPVVGISAGYVFGVILRMLWEDKKNKVTIDEIAKFSSLDKSTIKKALAILLEHGYTDIAEDGYSINNKGAGVVLWGAL